MVSAFCSKGKSGAIIVSTKKGAKIAITIAIAPVTLNAKLITRENSSHAAGRPFLSRYSDKTGIKGIPCPETGA